MIQCSDTALQVLFDLIYWFPHFIYCSVSSSQLLGPNCSFSKFFITDCKEGFAWEKKPSYLPPVFDSAKKVGQMVLLHSVRANITTALLFIIPESLVCIFVLVGAWKVYFSLKKNLTTGLGKLKIKLN